MLRIPNRKAEFFVCLPVQVSVYLNIVVMRYQANVAYLTYQRTQEEEMKKILTAGAVFLLVGSVQASSAEEQNIESKEIQEVEVQQVVHRDWAISGYIGIADFESEEKPDPFRPGVSHEMESEKAFKFGVVFSKYYNDFSFNLGIEYIPDAEVTDEADNVLAEHSHIPISLGVNYHFDTRLIDPYIGAGIGYSFNDSAESDFIAKQGMSGEHDHLSLIHI